MLEIGDYAISAMGGMFGSFLLQDLLELGCEFFARIIAVVFEQIIESDNFRDDRDVFSRDDRQTHVRNIDSQNLYG